jgi:hypothetical protein
MRKTTNSVCLKPAKYSSGFPFKLVGGYAVLDDLLFLRNRSPDRGTHLLQLREATPQVAR